MIQLLKKKGLNYLNKLQLRKKVSIFESNKYIYVIL